MEEKLKQARRDLETAICALSYIKSTSRGDEKKVAKVILRLLGALARVEV